VVVPEVVPAEVTELEGLTTEPVPLPVAVPALDAPLEVESPGGRVAELVAPVAVELAELERAAATENGPKLAKMSLMSLMFTACKV